MHGFVNVKFMMISCSLLLRMGNMSDKVCRENQSTRFIFSNVFRKSLSCTRVRKNTVQPRRSHMTMIHAHCMLHTKGYKHTLTICNTYCLSTTTMVARMRNNITLSVHCLSGLAFALVELGFRYF
jgi:hypothetical protein